ncbi:DNA polymerase III PolC-type [Candidatus Izimaplasma bacterium HR1]|jgi:predicted metal-dependent phosphoesterase TrpH|uniref:PHP domain-containing protein n=1 Tax=Candidatus Izimoplasma sp. HR1 TaxID=1541959 RepID=UPI0004F5C862|nr:DNA polymerase III PolC-type [Candidatus Izimaplasma bacterium HR1]
MKADLHMHSTYSDGLKTTEELFRLAKKNKVDIIAITDHDIVKDVEKNKEDSIKYGIKYIPGIELSTVNEGKPVHVLGYFKDDSYYSDELTSYYKEIKENRENRARKFIENLKCYFNIEITYQDVFKYSNGIIARPHIAKAITVKYPEFGHDYVFDNFIGDSSKAYVPSCELSVEEGINLLRRNNCVVVLAHPTLLRENIHDSVINHDFDGLEAVYYRNKSGDEDKYRSIAKAKNLIITAGSDYHGIPHDTKHGVVGEMYIEGNDLVNFLNQLKK